MKLNLGAGHSQIDGWTSVDIDSSVGADIVDDITILKNIPCGSCEEILCCHVFEHLYRPQVLPALRLWFSKLLPGGKLTLYIPDVRKFWQKYLSGHMEEERLLDVTYGVQGGKNPWELHKTAFWPERITLLLRESGFRAIAFIPPRFDTEFAVTAVKPF